MKRKEFFKSIAALFLAPFLPKSAKAQTVFQNPAKPSEMYPKFSTWRKTPDMSGSIELLSGPGGEIKNGDKIIYDDGPDGKITVFHMDVLDGKPPKNIRIIDMRYKEDPLRDMGLVLAVEI